ncbi:hypothetical protein ACFE04_030618 [Oxalis oulophora]
MAAQLIESNRQGAEIFYEDEICRQKIIDLLVAHRLPSGLIPLKDVTEFGYNKSTGFFWAKQKNKIEHKFHAIGKSPTYEQELSAFVEEGKMKKITGVKGKELMISFNIVEFSVDEKNHEKLNFVTAVGVKKVFPFSAFEIQK